ncbi:kinase-like domain-containing protein [Amylostereum chailletii]|nr:kinase-like domain-containing protein [Amylostereum chailletii]
MQPCLHSDVLESLSKLQERGFTLIGLSRVDEPTFDRYFREYVPTSIHKTLCGETCLLLCMRQMEPSFSIDGLATLLALLKNPQAFQDSQRRAIVRTQMSFILSDFWYCDSELGNGSFATVFGASNIISGECVAVKLETLNGDADEKETLPYESMIYRRLRGHPGIPSVHWSGRFDISNVLILDKLGPNLQDLCQSCRGQLSLKTILMLAIQMLDRIEFVHSRNIIVRDIKPENFAMGLGKNASRVYLFDFGLAKLFENPVTGQHMPYRADRRGMGTPRYCSYNTAYQRELSRRDDLESLGNTLLFFYHGRLPWQGIYAPNIPWKFRRIGEMKSGQAFQDLLSRSPPEFTAYFKHVRGLAFDDKPDYGFLTGIFESRMEQEGWKNDGMFDWIDTNSERGTLIPGEYQFETGFAQKVFEYITTTLF